MKTNRFNFEVKAISLVSFKDFLGKIISNQYLVFISFVSWFVVWRHGYPLVWDDTSLYKISLGAWDVRAMDEWFAVFIESLLPAFVYISASGYRPINSILQTFNIFHIESLYPSWGHLMFVGCFIGGLAVAFKLVADRFVESRWMVFAGLIIYLFSTPVSQSNWILYSSIPALVPLITCVGLLVYFSIVDQEQPESKKYWILGCLVILGLWYREYILLLPLTILTMELVRQRRVTKTSIVVGILVLFCLFPTAASILLFQIVSLSLGSIKVILGGVGVETFSSPEFKYWKGYVDTIANLPVEFVFQIGNLDTELTSTHSIKAVVSRHVLSIISPTMLILALIGFSGLSFVQIREQIQANKFNNSEILAVLGSLLGLIALSGMLITEMLWPYHLGIVALLIIAWTIDSRLAIWTTIYLGPFYLVYTERLHLAYVMLPISIILVAVLERCWRATFLAFWPRKLVRGAVVLSVAIGLSDALANPVVTQVVMSRIQEGIEEVARAIKNKSHDRPVAIIGNALHVGELSLYLDQGYQMLWTIIKGHNSPHDVVTTVDQLGKFLNAKLPVSDVYFLDMRQDYLPEKRDYQTHPFAQGCLVNSDYLGQLRRTKIEYLMLDPLRWYIDRRYFAFMGPPDLVDDFYYGPSSKPWHAMLDLEYHLYRVTSEKVKKWIPTGTLDLIDSDYFGYVIFLSNGRFFAVPVDDSEFSYEYLCRQIGSNIIESESYEEILTKLKN